ncbi:MAG: hypothetical protein DMG65_13935 [Candidatus Angelobacter sp. Gp1-AA117]|nr:MAG: hypothetical protein DMG65_13935 [Candidatus Angelobacter sp. Gp1-AA117]
MMPHKSWEITGLIVILAFYVWVSWYVLSKAAHSGWKWNYCLVAGLWIILAGTAILLFLRSTRRID